VGLKFPDEVAREANSEACYAFLDGELAQECVGMMHTVSLRLGLEEEDDDETRAIYERTDQAAASDEAAAAVEQIPQQQQQQRQEALDASLAKARELLDEACTLEVGDGPGPPGAVKRP
jgi:hypothetical protein